MATAPHAGDYMVADQAFFHDFSRFKFKNSDESAEGTCHFELVLCGNRVYLVIPPPRKMQTCGYIRLRFPKKQCLGSATVHRHTGSTNRDCSRKGSANVFAMRVLYIALTDLCINHSRVNTLMSQKVLNLLNRHAFVNRHGRKRSTEFVGMHFWDVQFPAQLLTHTLF